jgi:hypothetical protein
MRKYILKYSSNKNKKYDLIIEDGRKISFG